MDISVFGLGYVGVVSMACLASRGHRMIGVDVNSTKIDLINDGKCPIVEKDLPELLLLGKQKGLISATNSAEKAIAESVLSIICVGTPSRANGSLNTSYLENVCKDIALCLKNKGAEHILVFRSTMLPGTAIDTVIPLLEKHSGLTEGKDFHVVFNPEFLREATAVFDFNNPPKTVVGGRNPAIVLKVLDVYQGIPGPMIGTTLEAAEMVKYLDNNFHALKITFANEVGHICKKLNIDSHKVMEIFLQDTKLNISSYYLWPGFAFGGSCLPKDLRAVTYLSKMLDLETPMLNSMMISNQAQILAVIKRVIAHGKKKIGIAGFSFKAGTDDLRESPMIEVIETLLGKGYDLKLYDKNVNLARLMGANKDYIENRIPHIASLMVSTLDEIIADRELIIVGNRAEEFTRLLTVCREDQIIFDLVRIGNQINSKAGYDGICW